MRTYRVVAALLLGFAVSACQAPGLQVPPRTMGVSAGPDLVFSRPVAELVPALQGASATGENGRVGNELVFWGYQLTDNSSAFLFGCAPVGDVDCEARIARICPTGNVRELMRGTESGLVRELNCRAVGRAGIGDLLPNCTDEERPNSLEIGLLSCL